MNDPEEMYRELGERLRSYRVDAGFGIEDLAARTRIPARTIKALEEGRLEVLPGEAFVRGFIRSLCLELGRDSGPLLEIYNRTLEETSDRENDRPVEKRKVLPLYLSIGVILILIVGGILIHGETGQKGEAPEETSIEAAAPDLNAVAASEESPVAETAAEPREELNLVIRAIERTWLRVQADSSQPWETTMKAGDEIRLEAMDQIRLFIGNAGGIIFELNGRRFGPPGSQGQVISDYVITRDNL